VKSGTPEGPILSRASAPVMEHTALLVAVRELRKKLAALSPAAMLMAPGLKTVVPLVGTVLEGFEDLADRVQLLERRMAQLEGLPTPDQVRTLTA
jgi:hypothetical protein